jgi:murein DD-endopeptidase MepM/ murein hydrolase activator NlpD
MGKLIFGKPIGAPAGSKPTHAYGNSVRNHNGIDYPAPKGTEIVASERGIVAKAGFNKKLGNVVIIDHTPKAEDDEPHLYTIYGHLREKGDNGGPFAVNAGDTVKKRQLIGYCGDTGTSDGHHLHFAVAYVSGKQGMPPGDGRTWIDGSECSDPNKYIGIPHKINGTLNDLTPEERKALLKKSLSYKLEYKPGGKPRLAVLIGGKLACHIDVDNLNAKVKLKYNPDKLEDGFWLA